MALKASRKPLKLHPLARAPSPVGRRRLGRDIAERGYPRVRLALDLIHHDPTTLPGYVTDHGPRNKTPGDADRGVSRRGADRPDRDVLAPQPGRPTPGGGGADPR